MNSVVIRGLVNGDTLGIIHAIREWHDGEIILSTYDVSGDYCQDMPIDKLVLSKDPGISHLHNVKRQISLANAGVIEAKGEKILLTRTDILHRKNCFESVERDKITLLDFYGINPDFICPDGIPEGIKCQFIPRHRTYFKTTDFVQWGYAKEIMDWTSSYVKGLMYQYADNRAFEYPVTTIEQMWCVAYLNRRGYEIDLEYLWNSHYLRWDALMDNFLIVNHNEMDISILKPIYSNLEAIRQNPWCLTSELFSERKLNRCKWKPFKGWLE
tara:strand:- start:7848 stop:8657 length:810 start_codon:yes stop_codon:yes gene_type:complete